MEIKMTKEVLLTISGLQLEAMEEETVNMETILPAEYYNRNGRHFIVYDELSEGSSIITKNVLKFKENELDVIKRGEVNVHMMFEENKKSLSNYMTPFGGITVGINTRQIQMDEKEEQINLNVCYALEVNYQHVADCNITVNIQPRNIKGFQLH